jgi:hypothetical protein
MPPYTVRCVSVTINKEAREQPLTMRDTSFCGQPRATNEPHVEQQLPLVKLDSLGPFAWVTLLGSFVSLALFIVSIVLGDGMSLIATLLLSGSSTLVGLSNKWELQLPRKYTGRAKLPPGDVVIKFPNKSFLVVFCEEEVARELFWTVEEIKYHIENATMYRLISLIGTLMLMLGVVVLANAKLPLKFCWTGAYLLLNAAHWAAAALPRRLHWDFLAFRVEEQGIAGGPDNDTYMDALGKAIVVTKSVGWLRFGKAVPFTHKWDEWLKLKGRPANMCGYRYDIVDGHFWKDHGSQKEGVIWDMPPVENWTARGSWDKINGCLDGVHEHTDDPADETAVGASYESSVHDAQCATFTRVIQLPPLLPSKHRSKYEVESFANYSQIHSSMCSQYRNV